jgi:EAL domain-containing protein (putative c-di-GMP-specific phosphodiesterase class I)
VSLRFQPILSRVHGQLVGVQAFLGAAPPGGGLVPGPACAPAAEHADAASSIGPWALRAVCLQAGRWQRLGLRGFQVALTVTAGHLAQPGFADTVAALVAAADLEPGGVVLSVGVGESGLLRDPDAAARTVHRLRDAGVQVSVDGYGTGHTALVTLTRFRLDVVRLDAAVLGAAVPGAAVLGAPVPGGMAVARAVTDLAHARHLQVIAANVVTGAQHDVLTGLGVDLLQGTRYAPPVPAAQISARLRTALAS